MVVCYFLLFLCGRGDVVVCYYLLFLCGRGAVVVFFIFVRTCDVVVCTISYYCLNVVTW